jgi:hypothetical protein
MCVPRGGVIENLADQAARGAVAAVIEQLGPRGQGPLGKSLSATTQRISKSAVFPECEGPNRPACVRQQVSGLTAAAASGVGSGLWEAFAWSAVALSFGVGLLAGLLAVLGFFGLRRLLGGRKQAVTDRGPPAHGGMAAP